MIDKLENFLAQPIETRLAIYSRILETIYTVIQDCEQDDLLYCIFKLLILYKNLSIIIDDLKKISKSNEITSDQKEQAENLIKKSVQLNIIVNNNTNLTTLNAEQVALLKKLRESESPSDDEKNLIQCLNKLDLLNKLTDQKKFFHNLNKVLKKKYPNANVSLNVIKGAEDKLKPLPQSAIDATFKVGNKKSKQPSESPVHITSIASVFHLSGAFSENLMKISSENKTIHAYTSANNINSIDNNYDKLKKDMFPNTSKLTNREDKEHKNQESANDNHINSVSYKDNNHKRMIATNILNIFRAKNIIKINLKELVERKNKKLSKDNIKTIADNVATLEKQYKTLNINTKDNDIKKYKSILEILQNTREEIDKKTIDNLSIKSKNLNDKFCTKNNLKNLKNFILRCETKMAAIPNHTFTDRLDAFKKLAIPTQMIIDDIVSKLNQKILDSLSTYLTRATGDTVHYMKELAEIFNHICDSNNDKNYPENMRITLIGHITDYYSLISKSHRQFEKDGLRNDSNDGHFKYNESCLKNFQSVINLLNSPKKIEPVSNIKNKGFIGNAPIKRDKIRLEETKDGTNSLNISNKFTGKMLTFTCQHQKHSKEIYNKAKDIIEYLDKSGFFTEKNCSSLKLKYAKKPKKQFSRLLGFFTESSGIKKTIVADVLLIMHLMYSSKESPLLNNFRDHTMSPLSIFNFMMPCREIKYSTYLPLGNNPTTSNEEDYVQLLKSFIKDNLAMLTTLLKNNVNTEEKEEKEKKDSQNNSMEKYELRLEIERITKRINERSKTQKPPRKTSFSILKNPKAKSIQEENNKATPTQPSQP